MSHKGARALCSIVVTRRSIHGVVATITFAWLIAGLAVNPALAQSKAPPTQKVDLKTEGGQEISGILAVPSFYDGESNYPAVMLIHDWWGLSPRMEALAIEMSDEGYIVLAVDLYKGVAPATPAEARYQARNVKEDEAIDALTSWGNWLRSHPVSTGKLGLCGWSIGGDWSIRASMVITADATVIYYGNATYSAEELRSLKGPVLGHFGTRDLHVPKESVARFETEMKKAGRVATVHWYDGDHEFANPSSARYDEVDSRLAWRRSLDFFRAFLN